MGAVSSSEYRDLLEHTDARKWYDPDAPVVRVRHDAIIVLVCVCNALSRKLLGGVVGGGESWAESLSCSSRHVREDCGTVEEVREVP